MPLSSPEKKSFFAEWLEKLQQESWQLELLISGFALFGIHQSKDVIFNFQEYMTFEYTTYIYTLLYQVLAIGWRIFFFNLLIHVILRGLWIGAIGLRYVSGEIDYDKLNYSEYFTDYLKKSVGDYDDFIERLEKICSVIFSYTFLLFLFFVSLMSAAFFIALPLFFLDLFGGTVENSGVWIFFILIYFLAFVFFGFIVFIDFVSLGALKRIKNNSFSKAYSWAYIFYSLITLTYFYRPLIYNFIDNKYTKPLFYFSFPYILIVLFYNQSFTAISFPHIPSKDALREQGLVVNDYWYTDLAQAQIDKSPALGAEESYNLKRPHAILSAYHMKDPYASIFVRFHLKDESLLTNTMGITPIYKKGMNFNLFGESTEQDSMREELNAVYKNQMLTIFKQSQVMRDSLKRNAKSQTKEAYFKQQRDSLRTIFSDLAEQKAKELRLYDEERNTKMLDAFTSLIEISIDSIDYTDSLYCTFSKSDNSYNKGLRCNFPVGQLKTGNHMLTLRRKRYKSKNSDSISTRIYKLPFLKQF